MGEDETGRTNGPWIRSLNDNIDLFRGLPEGWVVKDISTGKKRVSSAAFKDPECSVDRSDMCSAQDTLDQSEKWVRVAKLSIKVPHGLGLHVKHVPDLRNQAHCIISGKKTSAVAKKLAKASVLI